jgi:hypothetical protein
MEGLMARRIKISAAELNIRLHPHDEQRYADFITALYALKKAVRIRGERHAILSLLDRGRAANGIYVGLITTFTRIDPNAPWFDASNLKEATDEQVSKISIPDGLFPNAASFYFLFDVRKHRLHVETYSSGKTLSVNSVHKLFDALAKDPQMTRRFGEALITIVQSRNALEQLFQLPVIKRVRITILKPNADVFADTFEQDIEEHLAQTNSKKIEIGYDAESGKSFTPTDDVYQAAQPALNNGNVVVEGRDEHGAARRSTEEYPKIVTDRYDPDKTDEGTAFRRLTGHD